MGLHIKVKLISLKQLIKVYLCRLFIFGGGGGQGSPFMRLCSTLLAIFTTIINNC